MTNDCIFTSMGMFIIDEIHFPENSGKRSHYNVIGGGGCYGALGSRIITGPSNSEKVGWIIDKGNDFPKDVEDYLKSWNTGAIWRETPERLTTRGWNMYGEREFRENKALLNSQSYHLICSPQRSIEILESLQKARSQSLPSPIITWEPVPDLCLPENLKDCLSVLPNLNVLTPNAEEAARFFSQPEPVTKQQHEELAAKFISNLTNDSQFQTGSGIVLRSGALGCFILTSRGINEWIPAYHNENNPKRSVIDPTGGGNTFIGGFTTGFVMSEGDWRIAALCGNIAAGIAIEQIGMPVFKVKKEGEDEWNGQTFKQRVESYIEWNKLDFDVDEVLRVLKLE